MDSREKILVIDDELAPRESIRMVLKDQYDVSTAPGAPEGLEMISDSPVDLVVMDIKMPKMDGITALQEIKHRFADIEVILLTAYASLDTAREAIRCGAFDYLIKPFDKDDILLVIKKGLEKRRANKKMMIERELLLDKTSYLESQVSEARINLMSYYESTVKALILTIDAKDHYTFRHSNRVAKLSALLAGEMGIPDAGVSEIQHAAAIHDIGKVGIVENILNKKGNLSVDEIDEMKKHPSIGVRIVESIPFLEEAIPVIQSHHERYDGSGYPMGLKGEDIPLSARIVAVADAIDAMMRDRPYRSALSFDSVLEELRSNAGTQFDPVVVNVILSGKVTL